MRYASRNDGPREVRPELHVSIDTLMAEARQVERERVLLGVRRAVAAIPTSQARDSSRSWDTRDRTARDVKADALAAIDRLGAS